jgi:prepilin-type N-terminal cleavage/methylation domain-containing protein
MDGHEHRHDNEQMLSHKLTSVSIALRDDQGFTLIELLVSMIAGVVVTGALFAILQISLKQTSLITDKVQANQLGRTAMTKLVDELHSACIAPNFTPVQEKSGESELVFKNAYSSEALLLNAKEAEAKTAGTGVFEHQVIWNESAKTLTDFIYKSESGEGKEAVFPKLDYSTSTHEAPNASPTKGVRLASAVTRSEEKNSAGEVVPLPIFSYYKYNTEYTSSSSTPVSTLVPVSATPLSNEEATETSAVLVRFRQSTFNNNSARDRYIDLSDEVTFAFSAPNAETPINASPCE